MREQSSPKTPANIFAERVKEVRQLRGLSQTELAQRLRIDRTTVSHIESGKRSDVSLTHLFAFAKALDIAPVYLLSPRRMDESIRLSPFGEPVPGQEAREWIRGKPPQHESAEQLTDWLLSLPQDEQIEYLIEHDPEIAATANSPLARMLVDQSALADRIRQAASGIESRYADRQEAATRRRRRTKEV
jgi:transcriptional regulator with XRE-family HTH domain